MTSEHLLAINNHLATLQGKATFRLQTGPLKERLTQEVLRSVEGETAEVLSGGAFDLEVNLILEEGDKEPAITFTVDHPGAAYGSEIGINNLSEGELEDISGYLLRLSETFTPAENTASEATGSKFDAEHHHEKTAASGRLKVSPEWLKRVVPCTDYHYEEIEGKKYIREYYWSKELIERLFRIKSTKTTPEDLQYVAKECCEGDVDWARDLIARLKSPNRPETPPKEQQPQRSQNRPGQSHNRPGQNQNRSAQGQNQNQNQNQNRPAQNQQNQNRPGTANAAPSERSRQRSRHKRPSREPGKDAGAKTEPAVNPPAE
jgi:hypothetical protein